MKLKASIAVIAILECVVLANPIRLAAQEHSHYKLIDLGTFGGPQSYLPGSFNRVTDVNDQGIVTGWADISTPDPFGPNFCFNEDCFVSHAFESRNNGDIEDLGVLPGGASSASSWISKSGLIAGFSENGETDPLFPGFPEVHAVLWKNTHITDLGTLPEGGYESVANAVNSGGYVVGLATNTIPDLNSIFGLGFQTRAFRWDERNGMQDLGTLGGTDATATLVNERGEIVGESYTSSASSAYCAGFGFPLTTGVFLWGKGEMKNVGSFGGTCTFAGDLNNKGEIVGISTLPGDQFQHAFLWQRGSLHELPNANGGNNTTASVLNEHGDVAGWASLPGDQVFNAALWKNGTMTNLGTLEGDQCSSASSINARGQVVGLAAPCDFSQITAFLWENGSIVDLNTLVPPSSSLYLSIPATINDRGEIAGIGSDSNGNEHAFLLIPCQGDDAGCRDAAAGSALPPTPPTAKPANDQNNPIRRMPRHRLGPPSNILVPRTSSEPSASGSAIAIPAAEEGAGKTRDFIPNSLDSLGADPIFRVGTTSSCVLPGRPCSPRGYPHCCGGLKCVFRGGSIRVGYMCE